ncbi:YihY/virulence factor BrkB family protein [Virgibacillus xinjiangensis]|uniref:YihY/virulence factor BrkB family protein n=1 Tax=Virgibacillus xinjiangensis TaxID=393090 RepID=A0ABV7CWN1_9BACI
MSKLRNFTKELMAKFKEDNVPLLAASQAYYYLLSIFPLLIVGFTILPYLNIQPQQAVDFIGNILPAEIASVLQENVVNLIDTPRGGLLTVGIIGALWSASNAVNAFIKASNEAYEVEETRNFIVVRLIALGLTLGMIISIAVAFLLPIFGNVIINFIESSIGLPPGTSLMLQVLRWAISIVILTAILLVLYHVAPNKKLPFKHILPGALTSSVLWQLTSLGFSFYVSNFGNYSATYGSLGGIIILMIWFFLTGLILMTGAVINVLYHKKQIVWDTEKQQASNI